MVPVMQAEANRAQCGQYQGQRHHVASDKAKVSGFTERFVYLFERAGMTLQDDANLLWHPQHGRGPYAGAHGPKHNQWVLDRLTNATRRLRGDACARALRLELAAIKADLLAHPALLKGEGLP